MTPPHCPNPACKHYLHPRNTHWYVKTGSYFTQTFGFVPRFTCKSCKKGFSEQTFSIDYYSKCELNYLHIYTQINAGAGIRNIARDLGVKADSVINRINRMGRSATLINQAIANSPTCAYMAAQDQTEKLAMHLGVDTTEYLDKLIDKDDSVELTVSYSKGPFREAYRLHSVSRSPAYQRPQNLNQTPYKLAKVLPYY